MRGDSTSPLSAIACIKMSQGGRGRRIHVEKVMSRGKATKVSESFVPAFRGVRVHQTSYWGGAETLGRGMGGWHRAFGLSQFRGKVGHLQGHLGYRGPSPAFLAEDRPRMLSAAQYKEVLGMSLCAKQMKGKQGNVVVADDAYVAGLDQVWSR